MQPLEDEHVASVGYKATVMTRKLMLILTIIHTKQAGGEVEKETHAQRQL